VTDRRGRVTRRHAQRGNRDRRHGTDRRHPATRRGTRRITPQEIPLIPDRDFADLSVLIHRELGINLTPSKKVLTTGRLYPLLGEWGLANYRALIEELEKNRDGRLWTDLADRITTGHTSFFREWPHFEFLLRTALPTLAAEKKNARDLDLRVWSAACSTGEEPYTLAMCLLKHFGPEYSLWKAGVLATDLSRASLATARAGRYLAKYVKNIPRGWGNFFDAVDGDKVEVVEAVRREVTFRCLNLTSPRATFPFRSGFDVIFCRNVMIYFDEETRRALVDRLYRSLRPGGYLFIGHSETLDRADGLSYQSSAVYRRTEGKESE